MYKILRYVVVFAIVAAFVVPVIWEVTGGFDKREPATPTPPISPSPSRAVEDLTPTEICTQNGGSFNAQQNMCYKSR